MKFGVGDKRRKGVNGDRENWDNKVNQVLEGGDDGLANWSKLEVGFAFKGETFMK